MNRSFSLLILLIINGLGCSNSTDGPDIGKMLPKFVDVSEISGITSHRVVSGSPEKNHIVECNTGGLAFLDYDIDGDMDLFIVNGSRIEGYPDGLNPKSALFRNDTNWIFTNVADSAGIAHEGWGMGVTAVDFNSDGFTDIYLSNYGPNAMYKNNGDGTFEDVGGAIGVDYSGWSSAATFADYDNDGDLDFYLSNYIDFDPAYVPDDMSFCSWRGINVFYGPRGMPGERDRLYRNEGPEKGWTFVEATEQFGIDSDEYYGFAAMSGDYDNDGDQDIYIANDSTPNTLYRNDNGVFTNVSLISATAYSEDGREQGGMGLASADYDADGDLDLFVTNFSHDNNTLYKNNGRGFFSDASFTTQIGKSSIMYLGWGTGFFDYDNDGDDDLFIANGHVYPAVNRHDLGTQYAQRNQLFQNNNGDFFEVEAKVGGTGLSIEKSSRGHAFADIDNDGDIDMAIVNIDDIPTLLRNDGGNRNNWLIVTLTGREFNIQAIGARAIAYVGLKAQLREVRAGTGYISQDDIRIHFGLGEATKLDSLSIRWPDGNREMMYNVKANQFLEINYPTGVTSAD